TAQVRCSSGNCRRNAVATGNAWTTSPSDESLMISRRCIGHLRHITGPHALEQEQSRPLSFGVVEPVATPGNTCLDTERRRGGIEVSALRVADQPERVVMFGQQRSKLPRRE